VDQKVDAESTVASEARAENRAGFQAGPDFQEDQAGFPVDHAVNGVVQETAGADPEAGLAAAVSFRSCAAGAGITLHRSFEFPPDTAITGPHYESAMLASASFVNR
jgi:hypothetical protein